MTFVALSCLVHMCIFVCLFFDAHELSLHFVQHSNTMINEHWCFEYFCATFALLFVIDGDGDAVCDGGNDISVPLLTAGGRDGAHP